MSTRPEYALPIPQWRPVPSALSAILIAVAPWVMLAISPPEFATVNATVGIVFGIVGFLDVASNLYSPSAQFHPGHVVAHTVAGVSCVQGAFALGYYALAFHAPTAFEPVHLDKIGAAYFTISTATTTGMGDIHPASGEARLIVIAQMVVGLFLVVSALGIAVQRLFARNTRFVDGTH